MTMLTTWETMNKELESATPAQGESSEQVQQVEQQGAVTTTEQSQENEPAEQPEQKKEHWAHKRISEVTREKYEARREADEAKQQAAQYRQQLERIQNGETIDEQEVDVRTLARQEAQRMVEDQRFNDACNKTYQQGKSEFENFDDSVKNLQMVGVSREFLTLVSESDVGAKLIDHLGGNLEKADEIAKLPPLQMARALTKLEFELSQPKAKPVSKAPAPIKPVGGNVSDTELRDDLPMEEWVRRERLRMSKR